MLEFFRQAIALRHAHPVLRHGEFNQLYAHGRQYAFVRHDRSEALLVILNASDDPAEFKIPVGDYYKDGEGLEPRLGNTAATTVHGGHVAISVRPRDGVVLSR